MTSVRESLNVVGQVVSLQQMAHQRNASFPLSLRTFVGAPPPGRIRRKPISLHFLQQKLDVIFDQRPQPLFKVKLDGTDYGKGALTVFFADSVAEDGYKIIASHEFQRNDLDIDIPIPGDHHFYFADLHSSGVRLKIIPEQPVSLETVLRFETGGPVEIHINNWRDVDLTRFNITIKFQFLLDSDNNLLVTQKDWITTDVSIASIPIYGDYVEGKIKSLYKN